MSISAIAKQTITIASCVVTLGNAGGEESRAYTTRAGLGGIPASIQNQRGETVNIFSRRGIKISHAIYSDVDISASLVGDRVTDQDGRVYIVRYVSDMAGRNRGWALYVDEIVNDSEAG